MLRLKSVKWESCLLSVVAWNAGYLILLPTQPQVQNCTNDSLSGTSIYCLWNNNTYINGYNFKGKEYSDVLFKRKHNTSFVGRVPMRIISFFASTVPLWILCLIIKPLWKFKCICFHYSFACDLAVLNTYVILRWKWGELEILCLFKSLPR